jgi:hypothetical protein
MANASRVLRSRRSVAALGLGALGVVAAGCGIHISKNGISGSIGGHQFSASIHGLPAGFPTSVPVPDNARVLGGAGTNGGYDAAFAVPGTVPAGAQAYEAKFRSAGFTVTDLTAPSTTGLSGSGQNSSSTTLTLTGASFSAKDAGWNVLVEIGSSSSTAFAGLKAGEFGVNITVAPASATPTG